MYKTLLFISLFPVNLCAIVALEQLFSHALKNSRLLAVPGPLVTQDSFDDVMKAITTTHYVAQDDTFIEDDQFVYDVVFYVASTEISINFTGKSHLLVYSPAEQCQSDFQGQIAIGNWKSVAYVCPSFLQFTNSTLWMVYSVKSQSCDNSSVCWNRWTLANLQEIRSFKDLFPNRWGDFGGMIIDMATDVSDHPFLYRDISGTLDGVSYRIASAIATTYNFTFTTTEVSSDDGWGSISNGTWTGMLGDIYRKEKHMTINYLTVTENRIKDFDSSISFFREGFGFIIRKPSPLPQWMSLVSPFSWKMWAAVLVALVTEGLFLYIIALRYSSWDLSLRDSVIIVIMAIAHQGIEKVPNKSSLRIFFAVFWMSTFILSLAYTCNLIAVFTIPVYPKKINSVEDLANSTLRLVMLDYGEFVSNALVISESKIFRKLGSKFDLVPLDTDKEYFGDEDTIETTLTGSHAHIDSASYLKALYALFGYSDKVYLMKEQIYEGNLAFFFQKGTPWKHVFDRSMRRLVEAGLVDKWYDECMANLFTQRSSSKDSQETGTIRALSINHLQGPFLLLALGYLASIFAFFYEIMKAKIKQ